MASPHYAPVCKSHVLINRNGASLDKIALDYSSATSAQLRESLSRHGVVVVRGAIPMDTMRSARSHVLHHLESRGFIAKSGGDCDDGVAFSGLKDAQPSLLSRQDVAFSAPVAAATTHNNVLWILDALLSAENAAVADAAIQPHGLPSSASAESSDCSSDENSDDSDSCIGLDTKVPLGLRPPPPNHLYPCLTQIPHAWLRAASKGLCTGPHVDRVYLGAGSERILTVWMPLMDVPVDKGALCVALGSHASESFERLRKEYGAVPASREGGVSGWISEYPEQIAELYGIGRSLDGRIKEEQNEHELDAVSPSRKRRKYRPNGERDLYEHCDNDDDGIHWLTMDFQMGDIAIFGLDLLHMTLNNATDRWRISIETRWQPTGDPYPPFFYGRK